jgi:hypothetical protein
MTILGKLLVFLNVLLAGLFLAMAIGVTSLRLNWFSYQPEDGERVTGIIEQLQSQMKKLDAAARIAEVRHRVAFDEVERNQNTVDQRRLFYAAALHAIRNGKDAQGQALRPPVQQLEYDAAGTIVPRFSGRAIEIEGRPADSLEEYLQEIARVQAAITAEQQLTQKLIKDQEELTAVINGRRDEQGLLTDKGLRQLLGEQIEFARLLQDEQLHLEPNLANSWAEAQLLLKRKASLSSRLQELQGTPVAARADAAR